MSKSFSNSSLGRDLPPQLNPSRMGFGSANQPVGSSGLGQMGQGSSRVGGFMDFDLISKMGQQRSHNMSSGSSPQSLQSTFRPSGRGSAPLSQPARETDQASTILASFGLSSSDLDELSRFPEDKITAENLPEIIQHLKRKRSENTDLLSNRERLSRDSLTPSSDNWDDLRPLRSPSGLNPVADFGHAGSSRELSHRERLEIENMLRERERLGDDRFLSEPSFRNPETDYNRMGYSSLQERPVHDKPRGMPSGRNIEDFRGIQPKAFPHICSLCDSPVNSFQNWNEHISGSFHKKQCLLLLELFPQCKVYGMGADPYILQQSSNPAPGIMGPPPPPMSMGGPNAHHGNITGPTGMEGIPRQRPMPNKQGPGRVVHVVNIERTKNLKPQLMKLVESFGTVTNSLILNSTKEAFIEMSTPAQARAVVNYYGMNPALVHGMPVMVLLSQKYKQIWKKEGNERFQQNVQSKFGPKPGSQFGPKPGPKHVPEQQAIEGPGCVLRICNLPQTGFPDSAVLNLAKPYGRIKNYIMMRMMHQAFIEMEKAEDAQTMIDCCNKTPLTFKGKVLQILLSQKYKTLILRIPNNTQLNTKKNRKRTRPSDDRNGGKKQKNKKDETDMVTTEEADVTEEMDLVTDSCEAQLKEEEEEEEEEEEDEDDDYEDDEEEKEATAVAMLETSGSGDEAKVPDIGHVDKNIRKSQSEALEPLSSTPVPTGEKAAPAFRGNMEGFVTLDEMGNVEGHKMKSLAGKQEKVENMETNKPSQTAPISEGATETNAVEQTDYDLGPYQPNIPTGVEYVIAKTGYYCRLCSLFYTNEEMAKVTHCCSLAHYQKLKNILSKPGKNPEKKN